MHFRSVISDVLLSTEKRLHGAAYGCFAAAGAHFTGYGATTAEPEAVEKTLFIIAYKAEKINGKRDQKGKNTSGGNIGGAGSALIA